MNYKSVLSDAKSLSDEERSQLIDELINLRNQAPAGLLSPRLKQLLEKQGYCPHCGSVYYSKFGKDNGVQRFICKTCKKTFTEYTGTWQHKLHKKELVGQYMDMMAEMSSLDRIVAKLHINKKTAFDWRHKILGTFRQDEGRDMAGIVESDETFLEKSDKGSKKLDRPARKRGANGNGKKGISDNKAKVIVTADRKNSLNMTFCGLGRLTKDEIAESLRSPFPKGVILCSDAHPSYKCFADENHLQHVTLKGTLREYVKRGNCHIQHVNSLHNRLKRWLANTFWGVATKYLQNYLNWFKIRETILKYKVNQDKWLYILSMQGSEKEFSMLY